MRDVAAKDLERKPAFVLVHGSWHGAWCFSKLVHYLLKAGHIVAARDLLGHGGLAKYPKSFGERPLDGAAFAIDVSNLKQAFAGDVSGADWEVVRYLLSPDKPAQPFVTPTETTRSRWGKIPRAYIECSGDFAIRPLTQSEFIDTADQFTPDNKTEVYELDTGHSPFLSQPEKLANVLAELAFR